MNKFICLILLLSVFSVGFAKGGSGGGGSGGGHSSGGGGQGGGGGVQPLSIPHHNPHQQEHKKTDSQSN